MKLGTLKSQNSLDGELIVVSQDNKQFVKASGIAAHLREAIEKWDQLEPQLQKLYRDLNSGQIKGEPIQESSLHACLPRTFLFADGSAFIYHVKLVRMARKAPLPETLETAPLMYQGEAGGFLAPTEDIPQLDFNHGTDFEGEVGVITSFVPMGITPEEALKKIRLFVLINDVSLRGLIPEELSQGFGFFQSKPTSSLAPFAITADELGNAWRGGRIHLPLQVNYNDKFFGQADAGQMHFHFGQLIAHAARTRNLAAGSIIGSGTVSQEKEGAGSSCLAEKRMIEQIYEGGAKTSFMKAGDRVEIKMLNEKGQDLFGRIYQKVTVVKPQ